MSKRKKKKIEIKNDEQDQQHPDVREADEQNPQETAESAEAVRTEDPSEVEQLRQRVAELEEQLLRARAEQQNIRKRAANELSESVRFANAAFAKSLLTMADDFDRTLEQSQSADAATVLEGVRLIYDNLMKVLSDHNVESIDALGRPFDPRFHEAMMQQPAGDKEPGTVLEVLQKGFKLGDRVLRPAKVIVAVRTEDAMA
jgi:molecular chaperone GrpE